MKVGDWIIPVHNRTLITRVVAYPYGVREVDCADGNYYDENSVEVWKPDKGEWCWLNNGKAHKKDFPSLVLIKYNKYFISEYKNSKLEPFRDKLPTYLKDKS